MSAQRTHPADFSWLHDDTEEDLVGADWHQRAIRNLSTGLQNLARQRGLPWHVGDQLTIVGWKPNGAPWRPMPDISVHPTAGPALREELSVREDGPLALVIEVASKTTWRYDVDTVEGKALGYAGMGIAEYLVFDPHGDLLGAPCRAWRGVQGRSVEWRPDADGRYRSGALSIAFEPDGDLLRIYDPEDRPVLYDYEKSAVIETQAQRIETQAQEIERLRQELERLRRTD